MLVWESDTTVQSPYNNVLPTKCLKKSLEWWLLWEKNELPTHETSGFHVNISRCSTARHWTLENVTQVANDVSIKRDKNSLTVQFCLRESINLYTEWVIEWFRKEMSTWLSQKGGNEDRNLPISTKLFFTSYLWTVYLMYTYSIISINTKGNGISIIFLLSLLSLSSMCVGGGGEGNISLTRSQTGAYMLIFEGFDFHSLTYMYASTHTLTHTHMLKA